MLASPVCDAATFDRPCFKKISPGVRNDFAPRWARGGPPVHTRDEPQIRGRSEVQTRCGPRMVK
jgi:hypothetical protein